MWKPSLKMDKWILFSCLFQTCRPSNSQSAISVASWKLVTFTSLLKKIRIWGVNTNRIWRNCGISKKHTIKRGLAKELDIITAWNKRPRYRSHNKKECINRPKMLTTSLKVITSQQITLAVQWKPRLPPNKFNWSELASSADLQVAVSFSRKSSRSCGFE